MIREVTMYQAVCDRCGSIFRMAKAVLLLPLKTKNGCEHIVASEIGRKSTASYTAQTATITTKKRIVINQKKKED